MIIEIQDTAYGGFGVGRCSDGRVIFIPHTVEGDIVDITVTDDKKSFCYGRLDKIIKHSSMRIEPFCPKAEKCGGCLFSHIAYESQLNIKEKIIKNAFRKYIHELKEISFVNSSSRGYRLRATIRAKEGKPGFFAFRSNDFISVEGCPIIKGSLFDKTKVFIEKNKLTGEVYSIETDEGIAFAFVKTSGTISRFKEPFDGLTLNGVSSGLEYAGYNTPYGAVGIGHKSFFQANRFLLNDFQEYASNLCDTVLNITELYSGGGFFTSALKEKCNEIKACEIDKDGVKLASIFGYPSERADAGDFLENIKETDILFMDPARDGVSNKVIKNILRINPRKIIYVSCNPTTLARDLIKLENNYKLKSLKVFDMFPDTFHIETVAELVKI